MTQTQEQVELTKDPHDKDPHRKKQQIPDTGGEDRDKDPQPDAQGEASEGSG